MDRKQYFELTGLAGLYLEDSYVLRIDERGDALIFYMEFVLTESHPEYESPKLGEQYCYRYGDITFPAVTRVAWLNRDGRKSVDADGKTDIGNIDSFYYENSTYHLEGGWGVVKIISALPQVKLLPKGVSSIVDVERKR